MIKISVVSYNNEMPAEPLSAEFDAAGAMLGRGDDNWLVLRDPNCYVSRVQASIKSDGQRHTIVNLSRTNPILVNGKEIVLGQEADLRIGDEINIGLYMLRAEPPAEAKPAIKGNVTPPARIPQPASRAASVAEADLSGNTINMPFIPDSVDEPPKIPDAQIPAKQIAAQNIDDLRNVPSSPVTKPAPPALPAAKKPVTRDVSLDDDLLSRPGPITFQPDRSAAVVLDDFDPITLSSAASEHLSELKARFAKPPTTTLPDIPKLADSIAPRPKIPPAAPRATLAPPVPSPKDVPIATAPSEKQVTAAVTPENPAVASNENLVDSLALAQAFMRGANLPLDTIPSGVTLEWMEMMGRFVASTTQGTIELIASRAMVKREFKADSTAPALNKKNNPLKSLPDGRAALIQLMSKTIPGFMEPVEAMQDAYLDLRTHQIGVIAGVRAALNEVIRRFDPLLLEKKLKTPSLLDSLATANRKAKLWDLYAELFNSLDAEAQDDFQTLFGQVFLTAYKTQVERLVKETS